MVNWYKNLYVGDTAKKKQKKCYLLPLMKNSFMEYR